MSKDFSSPFQAVEESPIRISQTKSGGTVWAFFILFLFLPGFQSCTNPPGIPTADRVRLVDQLEFASVKVFPSSLKLARDRSFLEEGWSRSEKTDVDGEFVWVEGKTASVAIPLYGVRPQEISFRVQPYTYAGSPTQSLRLFLNDLPISKIDLATGWRNYTIRFPKNGFRRGVNDFRFEFGYAAVPKNVAPPSADDRELSAAFDTLTIDQTSSYKMVANETKEVLLLTRASEYVFPIQLPENPVLLVDEGVDLTQETSGGTSLHWAILVRQYGIEKKIEDRVVGVPSSPDNGEWSRIRIPLTGYSGKRVSLIFRSLIPSTDTKSPPILLGDPTVARGNQGPERPNVVLISLDTLRADHLGVYGYRRNTSPHLDLLAKSGALFTNAVSASAWTLPSHVSLMTSLYPDHHGVISHRQKMASSTLTLARAVRSLPYASKGFITHHYVDAPYGFNWGFESFEHVLPHLAGQVTSRAIDWLGQNRDSPFFIFLHYFDIHSPFDAPEPFREMYDYFYRGDIRGDYTSMAGCSSRGFISDRDLYRVIALYDGEIRYTDEELGRLFDYLKRNGLWENTAVIVTADHGEELWEHKSFGHGATLYQDQIHIPLIIHYPKWFPQPVRFDQVVSLVDIYPTILDILGIPVPEGLDGRSLQALLQKNPKWDNTVYSQTARVHDNLYLTAVREEYLKGIWSQTPKELETYNLEKDPAERENLVTSDPETSGHLNTLIQDFLTASKPSKKVTDKGTVQFNKETEKNLRALGYIQ